MASESGSVSTDFLKTISFTVLLAVAGILFLLLALSGGFAISGTKIMLATKELRIASAILGLLLIGTSIVLEAKIRFFRRAESDKPQEAVAIAAQEFFHTLDESPADSFPNMVKDAVRVEILSRTAVNLLSQYRKVFEELGKNGCEIRLLLGDPASDACKFLYGSRPELYRYNVTAAAEHVKELKNLLGSRFQVHVTKYAPTMSIVIVEKRDAVQGFAQVQLYFLHGAVGRDRPVFRIDHGDRWYSMFSEEFLQLWTDSVEWNMSAI